MRRNALNKLMLIFLVVGVAACTRATPTPTAIPTPSPPSPTDTPLPAPTATATSAQPTASPTPQATPTLPTPALSQPVGTPTKPVPTPTLGTGPLPELLAEVDFTLLVGNAYNPNHLALDRENGLLYAAARRCPGSPSGCIAQVNPDTRQTQRLVSLPGSIHPSFAAAGGWLFVSYTDESFTPHLASIEAESGRRLVDLLLEGLAAEVLAVDPVAGRLYVRQANELQVRDTFDLQPLASADFLQSGWRLGLQLAAKAGRVYVFTEDAVYGRRAEDLSPLWTFQENSQGKFTGLVLDEAADRLYVETEGSILALDTASGHLVAEVPGEPRGKAPWDWSLLAVDTGGDWMCLRHREGARTWLELVGLSSGEVRARLRLWHGEDRFLFDRASGRLNATRRDDHEVAFFHLGPQAIVAEEPIPTGIEIRSLAVDAPALRLYLTDSHGRLHVIQADEGWENFQEQATLEGRGQLYLDSQHGRLYVSEDHGPSTRIYDSGSLELLGDLDVGGAIALDPDHDRWFLGHEIRALQDEEVDPVVHVFAWEPGGTDFQEIATVPQPGLPAYNPLRNELYIVDDTVYVVDTQSWQVEGQLLPGYHNPDLRRYNGCNIISDLTVAPERNLLLAHVWPISVGKGAGLYPGPKLLDATTLQPVTPTLSIHVSACDVYPGAMPGVRADRLVLITDPIDSHTYENRIYSRYVSFRNILVHGADGEAVDWLDGLEFTLVDPVYRHGLAPVEEQALVIDLDTLTPLGHIPQACVRAVDWSQERWFATRDARLLVYSLAGAEPTPPPGPQPGAPDRSITKLYPSPDFGRDQTLFAIGGGRVYRSRDGGATWEHLRGGLPDSPGLLRTSVTLALSPNFGRDQTLFAAMYQGDWLGLGVYRSQDGGDTWESVWNGLQALRVRHLVVSPRFAEDGRVAAYARYQFVGKRFEGGEILYLSSNRGDSWTEAGRHPHGVADAPELPALETLLPLRTPDLQFRVATSSRNAERSTDGGSRWTTMLTLPEGSWIQNLLVSPDLEADPSVFAFTSKGLFWSPDAGQTWQQSLDPRLSPGPSGTWWLAAAYVPSGAGGPLLIVALGDGFLLRANPRELAWQPVREIPKEATSTPAPTEPPTTSTPCEIEPAHFAALYGHYGPRLGCATSTEHSTWSAWQPFERGAMLWLEETREIWILEDDGHWQRFQDTWAEDQPESDPNLVPPSGLLQPIRGFGKVWRESLGGPAAAIGWALAPEQGRQTIWQPFDKGWAIEPEGVATFVVFADGRWESPSP